MENLLGNVLGEDSALLSVLGKTYDSSSTTMIARKSPFVDHFQIK